VRQRIEFAGDTFENVGEAVGNRVHQAGKDRSTAQRVTFCRQVTVGERLEHIQLFEPHRDQPLVRQHEANWRRQRLVGVGAIDERRAQINRAVAIPQAARTFDLAQVGDTRQRRDWWFA
jgi:hypothetical protein